MNCQGGELHWVIKWQNTENKQKVKLSKFIQGQWELRFFQVRERRDNSIQLVQRDERKPERKRRHEKRLLRSPWKNYTIEFFFKNGFWQSCLQFPLSVSTRWRPQWFPCQPCCRFLHKGKIGEPMNKKIYPLLFINIIPSKNSISCTGLQHGVDFF